MASQGPLMPATYTTVYDYSRPWVNHENIQVEDGIFSTNQHALPYGWSADAVRLTNFGFSIPTDATIGGILLEVKAKCNYYADYPNYQHASHSAWLWWGGALHGNNQYSAAWGTTLSVISIGGTNNKWGASPTPANFNDSGFGIYFNSGYESFATDDAILSIDVVKMTVYYTLAGYKHKVSGVPAANIAKIMGIPIANVGKFCGV